MLSPLSSAMPQGRLNSPGPLPAEPNWLMNWPSMVYFCTRLFLLSTTSILPSESMAKPEGPFNWPSPEPPAPHLLTYSPSAVNLVIRFSHSSAT